MNLVLMALDHAVESVVASGGPLVPFAMIEVDGNVSLARFAGDLEEGQRRSREAVNAATNATRAAVAWDGYLTLQGARTDAVFAEASEIGDSESVVARRHEVVGRLRKSVRPIGNAALAARQASIL